MIINTQATNAKLLVKALLLNGIFSFFSGLILLIFPTQFSQWLGQLPPMYITILGAGLILFALRLFYLAGPGKLLALEAKLIIGSDLGWVLAATILVTVFFNQISMIGIAIVTGTSLSVTLFAWLQSRGLKCYLSLV